MKEGWVYMSLGEICDFISGFTPKKEELNSENGIPYFKVSDMNRLSNSLYLTETELFVKKAKKIIPANSIVFPKNGGAIFTGKKRILAYDSIVDLNTEAIKINNNNVLLTYLFQYLLFVDFGQFDNGGGLPSINIKKMKEHIIPVPPLSDQQRIVSYLDAEFAKIEALKANAEKQLQAAKDLFQAALDSSFCIQNSKPLGKLVNVINGFAFKSEDFKKDVEVKVIKITNVGVGHFVEDDSRINKIHKNLDIAKVYENDIVIALTRTIIAAGLKVATVPHSYNEALLNQRVACLRENGKSSIRYIYYYLSSNTAIKYVLSKVNTLMQPNLSIFDLKAMPIPYLEMEKQNNLVAQLDVISAKVKALQSNYTKTITLCNDLKQALLKKVFE